VYLKGAPISVLRDAAGEYPEVQVVR
jgi:hypothetical protein